jgi:hypothetical protein
MINLKSKNSFTNLCETKLLLNMIQRKQTLWLLFATIAAFLTFQFPFYTGNILVGTMLSPFRLDARFNIVILMTTNAIAVISLITIFLFKDRKKQIALSTTALLLSLTTIGLYFWQSRKFVDGTISFTAVLTLLVPVLLVMAIVGIYKDEKLIKSVDRLR